MSCYFGIIFIVLYLETFKNVYSNASIRRIENRLTRIEDRLDSEMKFMREEMKLFITQLGEIERHVNFSKESNVLNGKHDHINDDSDSDIQGLLKENVEGIHDGINQVLLKAFRDEKQMCSDIRKRLPFIENQLAKHEETTNTSLQYAINASNKAMEQGETISNLNHAVSQFTEQVHNTSELVLNDMRASILNIESVLPQLTERNSALEQKLSKHLYNSKAASCVELYNNGHTTSGIYSIYPDYSESPIRVYCDQDTDGGGWTVFQRRKDGSVDFFRDWSDYKSGFGDREGEFWLGNEYLSTITGTCCHELRVDLGDFENNHRFEKYTNFKVGTETDGYVLTMGGYSGDAGDSLSYHSNTKFSTKDRDNDKRSSGSCAQQYKGGWWYGDCYVANLNGLYLHRKYSQDNQGISWYPWPLKRVEMKFRSLN